MTDSDENEEDQTENTTGTTVGLKAKKIGHRRVDHETGLVSYKKVPTSGLMNAMQIGIGHAVSSITPKESRDILMKDFQEIDLIHFPSTGSPTTPAHRCKDFLFKVYAPRAFKKFREDFGIEADNFLVSLCTKPLKELSNPGASGSLFFLSHDDNFIIKTIQRKEAIFLQKLLPGYYLNLTQNKETCLPKFYGSFQYESMGKTIRITVMNNILPSSLKYHEKYDLKGSMYKRQASGKEMKKGSPTLKDLDFLREHPGGLLLEPDLYDDLKKTLERDMRVLESFRIMDYSILLGIHNITLTKHETLKSRQPNLETRQHPEQDSGYDEDYAQQVLSRIGSKRNKDDWKQDDSLPLADKPPPKQPQTSTKKRRKPRERGGSDAPRKIRDFNGGFPAVNEKGEQCLLFLGIIDILQSYRFLKKVEHSWKSVITDGDTVSVHRPGFYAERFKNFCFDRVFKRGDDSSPQIRRNKSGVRRQQSLNYYLSASGNKANPNKSKAKEVPTPKIIEPQQLEETPGPSAALAPSPLAQPEPVPSANAVSALGASSAVSAEFNAVSALGSSSAVSADISLENVSINVDKSDNEDLSNHTELRTVLV